MTSTATTPKTQSFSRTVNFSRVLAAFAWAVLLGLIAYFVLREVPRFLVWSEASYGAYYWPRATITLPHILVSLLSLVIGPFQFWPRIRNGYPKLHRMLGRTYLVSVLIGGVTGLVMAVISSKGFFYASGLFGLALAWLLTSGMAFVSVLKRNFIQHKQWMVRSYVVTFAFVTIRSITTLMIHYGVGIATTDRQGLATWVSWAVPLFIAELVIQGKQVFAGGTRSGVYARG
jgi:hypothetical protein